MPSGRRSTDTPPRFCPRCRRLARGDATLCDRCGESLAPQGYCGICDRYWPRAEGEDCPKHEIPLGAADPPAAHDWPSDVPLDWVTVRSYPHPIAAEVPRLRLDAEGIPTFLAGERMGANSLYQGATGGVKLQVPRALLADARILLAQSWAPPVADDAIDGEEPDDPPVAVEPIAEPEFPPADPGNRWIWAFLVVAALALAATVLAVAY